MFRKKDQGWQSLFVRVYVLHAVSLSTITFIMCVVVSTVQYSTVQYCTALHCTDTVLFCTELFCTVPYRIYNLCR